MQDIGLIVQEGRAERRAECPKECKAGDKPDIALAHRAAMSPRNFARVFAREVGATPARWVERARVEAARRRMEEGRAGAEAVAEACGFGHREGMRRAFRRQLGVAPREYRQRFTSAGGAP